MTVVSRIALAAGVLAASFLSTQSEAGIGVLKPDLKILSITPSPLGSGYARVIIGNAGNAPSGSCTMSLGISFPTPKTVYHSVPGIPSNIWNMPAVSIDVYLAGGSSLTPGQIFYGVVDCFSVVAESNELNNTLTES